MRKDKKMNENDEDIKKLVADFLSALDNEMELGDYHFDDTFASDEKVKEYEEAVDETVFLRKRLETAIGLNT